MDYNKVMEALDCFEELSENIYSEVLDLKAMMIIAHEKDLEVDLDKCLKEVVDAEDCYKALVKINTCLLKMKVALLESGVFVTQKDLLKCLIEVKITDF